MWGEKRETLDKNDSAHLFPYPARAESEMQWKFKERQTLQNNWIVLSPFFYWHGSGKSSYTLQAKKLLVEYLTHRRKTVLSCYIRTVLRKIKFWQHAWLFVPMYYFSSNSQSNFFSLPIYSWKNLLGSKMAFQQAENIAKNRKLFWTGFFSSQALIAYFQRLFPPPPPSSQICFRVQTESPI